MLCGQFCSLVSACSPDAGADAVVAEVAYVKAMQGSGRSEDPPPGEGLCACAEWDGKQRAFRASALERQALTKQGQRISGCASPLSSSWGSTNLLLHAGKSYAGKLCFGAWFCAKHGNPFLPGLFSFFLLSVIAHVISVCGKDSTVRAQAYCSLQCVKSNISLKIFT